MCSLIAKVTNRLLDQRKVAHFIDCISLKKKKKGIISERAPGSFLGDRNVLLLIGVWVQRYVPLSKCIAL